MKADQRAVLEARLTEAMFDLYTSVGQATGYWANYFLRDLKRLGGMAVAKKLLASGAPSNGFERLKKERMLNRSLEAIALSPQFQALFTRDELDVARTRLKDNGYAVEDLAPPAEVALPAALTELLLRVENAPDQMSRWDLRDDVVAFGPAARGAMSNWLARDFLPAFAISVLEKLAAGDPAAARAIDHYATFGGKELDLARAALNRVKMAGA